MKQWSIAKLNKENAKTIAEEYSLPDIVATLLEIRGVRTEDEIRSFLFNESELSDPYEIKDMDKAVSRIKTAVENGEKICVYGDYDADGVTSTALLYSYFETLGADVIYYIPSRESEGYGMNKEAVDSLKEKNVDLIVTVDNGISAVDEIKYAKSLGIDTVVTDHHMPSEVLPDACAVVDMHREDCPSSFKKISGVGVAFKLVTALEGPDADVDMLLDNYADLLCIGTIGDIMPLVNENRVFVKRGLKSMNNSDRIGIKALIDASDLSEKEIDSGNVSFGLVPRINAGGRLGLSDDSVNLLTTDDSEEAYQIASKLSDDNSERQKIERNILADINLVVANNYHLVSDRVIVIDGEGWHHGVVGIVSSRIKDIFGKPCIVLSRSGSVCRGSGRSVEGFDLWKAVSSCSDILDHFGGHPMAVGLGMNCDQIEAFRKRINEYARSFGEMPMQKLNIDFKLNSSILDVSLASDLSYLEPYGAGNPTPVFQLSNLVIVGVTPLSQNRHLKIHFSNGKNSFYGLKFYCSTYDFHYQTGDKVDIAVNLDVNYFNYKESLSVIIKDMKFHDADKEANIHSLRLFEYFCNGEELTKEQLRSIIPNRDIFAMVYRYLSHEEDLLKLDLEVIVGRYRNRFSYGKLMVTLYALRELGLINMQQDMFNTSIEICKVTKKVDLMDAPIMQKLKEVYQNG